MKLVYAVILSPAKEGGYVVSFPDLPINTQGETIANAIEMARDALGLYGICEEDMGRSLSDPPTLRPACASNELVALVDIDLEAYRRAHNSRTVRRNVTLPAWLDDLATKSNINCSAVFQRALKSELGV